MLLNSGPFGLIISWELSINFAHSSSIFLLIPEESSSQNGFQRIPGQESDNQTDGHIFMDPNFQKFLKQQGIVPKVQEKAPNYMPPQESKSEWIEKHREADHFRAVGTDKSVFIFDSKFGHIWLISPSGFVYLGQLFPIKPGVKLHGNLEQGYYK